MMARSTGHVASMADDGFEGDRPGNTLTAPRGGKPDDLKLINGIGRGIEDRLNKLGIWHFDQIAAMNDEELKFVSHWAGFPGRALRENWKSEAAILGKGGDTEHSRAVKAGKIPSASTSPKTRAEGFVSTAGIKEKTPDRSGVFMCVAPGQGARPHASDRAISFWMRATMSRVPSIGACLDREA